MPVPLYKAAHTHTHAPSMIIYWTAGGDGTRALKYYFTHTHTHTFGLDYDSSTVAAQLIIVMTDIGQI